MDVYVLDTSAQTAFVWTEKASLMLLLYPSGINIHHLDFDGRASWGKTFELGDGEPDKDTQGHGTHVAVGDVLARSAPHSEPTF